MSPLLFKPRFSHICRHELACRHIYAGEEVGAVAAAASSELDSIMSKANPDAQRLRDRLSLQRTNIVRSYCLCAPYIGEDGVDSKVCLLVWKLAVKEHESPLLPGQIHFAFPSMTNKVGITCRGRQQVLLRL